MGITVQSGIVGDTASLSLVGHNITVFSLQGGIHYWFLFWHFLLPFSLATEGPAFALLASFVPVGSRSGGEGRSGTSGRTRSSALLAQKWQQLLHLNTVF